MSQDDFAPRIARAWQIENQALVLSISVSRDMLNRGIKKLFLVLDISGVKPQVSLRIDKPAAAEPKGILSDQFRKHLIGSKLIEVARDKDFAICLSVESSIGIWQVVAKSERPTSCTLVNPQGQVFGKITPSQAFTKRYPVAVAALFHAEGKRLILNELLAAVTHDSHSSLTSHDQSVVDSSAAVISASQRDLIQSIKRRIRTTKKSLARLDQQNQSEQDVAMALQRANALQLHLGDVERGMERMAVDGLEIALDPLKTPGENLDQLFKAYKRSRGAFENLRKVIQQTQAYMQDLHSAVELLRSKEVDPIAQVQLAQRCRIPMRQQPKSQQNILEPALPYRVVRTPEQVEIKVGKGPTENDILTKAARGNDWWVHVVQGSGSHLVISAKYAVDGRLPSELQRQAAILAIHYSKSRAAREGEVYITQRHHLRKTKGLKPGLWLVDRSQSLFVRYELPELRTILGGSDGDNEHA